MISLKMAAQSIGVSAATVRKLVKSRKLPYYKIGKSYKFKPEDIEAFMLKSFYSANE